MIERLKEHCIGTRGLARVAYYVVNEQDRERTDTDVVVWHTFGVTHIVRPEEWPVMPVESTSFWLIPAGFFDGNPALDVPPGPCHTVSP